MLKATLFLFLTQTFSNAHAQLDVLHYQYQLQLSDASDTLNGTAFITLRVAERTRHLALDLASVKNGKGMHVRSVAVHDTTFSFTHLHDTLAIALPHAMNIGDSLTIAISYAGIPADGLVIAKNKYNERTFFADNWPNRAHQWLPCNDRPDDKATVAFEVTAPSNYKIISNGVLVSEKEISDSKKITHWKHESPIPTKVMVIGAARFAVKQYDDSTLAPVSAWVYPQDSTKGFYDYALTPAILKFFTAYIGPYPFEKLANVQSKTIFGGMENASAIFYGEKTVTGDRKSEALMAHEIAHQWFGNSATEQSFAHLWLSEGFASYLTLVYLEQKYGRDTLVKRLKEDRNEIIQFSKQWPFPVMDSVSALMDLLNANSYEKGSWVLHMLRQEVGDSLFQTIIRTYYDRYKFSNADTWAFEKVAEEVSGKNLKDFFQQWLFTPGVPQLTVTWHWSNGQLQVSVRQMQKKAFAFPLQIGVQEKDKAIMRHRLTITKPTETFTVPSNNKPVQVVLDPDTGLLFEGTISEKK